MTGRDAPVFSKKVSKFCSFRTTVVTNLMLLNVFKTVIVNEKIFICNGNCCIFDSRDLLLELS